MIEHLRRNFNGHVSGLSYHQLRELICEGIRKAARHGVQLESDVSRFIEYMILYARDFDTSPQSNWAARILRSAELTGTQKMDRIDDCDPFINRRNSGSDSIRGGDARGECG